MSVTILTDYEKPVEPNPYLDTVDAIVAAGEGATAAVTVSTFGDDESESRGGANTQRIKIQKAARERGFTARILEQRLSEDGKETTFYVRLTSARPGGPRGPRKPRDTE